MRELDWQTKFSVCAWDSFRASAPRRPSSARVNWWRRACLVLALCASMAIAASAQSFKTLLSFDYSDGAAPNGLVQATDGNLYGTTFSGGSGPLPSGTIFKVTPTGKLTNLYNFCSQLNCGDGSFTYAGLVQDTSGSFYGVTTNGGPNDYGTVFEMTPGGVLTTLYSFCSQSVCADGGTPTATLILGTDGNLYGTTNVGGTGNSGTIYRVTPGGVLTTLYSFCSQADCVDGNQPFAPMVQGTDGNFYGTTSFGGANGDYGTVFKITPTGTLTTVYSFCSYANCTDGDNPNGLVQARDGNFYGTTVDGGSSSACSGGCGTVFKITSTGVLTTLHSFCSQTGCTDGEYPGAALLQGTDGNLYGVTSQGGAHGFGTLFRITTGGKLTTLHSFCSQQNCTDGANPGFSALIQDTNGKLYGTTGAGGSSTACRNGCGTVFSLSVGLPAFVETQPTSGKIGASIKILGTNLTGATSVTFNGTAAIFKVASPSLITTTVPSGARTGPVQVVTPGGMLSSNVPFRVNE